MTEVAALILAAGTGTRFQSRGESKASHRLGDKPLIRHVVEIALASTARPVIVVVGHAEVSLRDLLTDLDVSIVQNVDYASGMASSLKIGIGEVPASHAGTLVLLADMPFVQPRTLDGLISAFVAHSSADAIVPTYQGKVGNPVVLARRLFGELAALDGDRGARAIWGQPGRSVIEQPVSDAGILRDIDTREALEEANRG